jgi:DNA-binding SARP family transcriptional activator/predicted ATPase
MPTSLHAHMLGAVHVVVDDAPCLIPRAQIRALLYRLATKIEPVAREHLCFLFWPDKADTSARRTLTQALSHLRRCLPDPDLIETMADHVCLDPARVWSDVMMFESLCGGGEQPIDRLKEAVALYRGPFLNNLSMPNLPKFEIWQREERQRLEQLYLNGLAELLRHAVDQEAHTEAIGYAQRYLAVNKLDEMMHRQLMMLHVANGNRSAALQQYEQCVVVLARELEVEPDPETRAAYDSIRGEQPERAAHPISSSATSQPGLQIELFGTFRLTYAGHAIVLESARLQSLLAYLLLHAGTSQLRHHLAFIFWPDSSEAQARTNLRYLLHQLRTLLPDADLFLDVKPGYLRWRLEAPYTLDVAEYERAVQQATEAKQTGDRDALPVALERAVVLYREDLLPSCYDDWIVPARERLRAQFTRLAEQLIELLEEQRDYRNAIRYAQHLLRHDPLHEETYRCLMRLHALDGARARALRIYHTCVTTLQQELGGEPMPETRAVYERLLNPEAVPLSSSPTTALATTLPLIGRQAAWQQLLASWHGATHTGARFVLITGEAGIGKTRLAEELLAWVEQQGFSTASSRSYAAGGGLAYAPVSDWLRSHVLRSALPALDKVWRTEVARLLPELLAAHPDLPMPEPMKESWQRQRLFEALARAVLAVQQPILLVLDDLQWCDRETLEWLHYLLRFAHQAKLLLVGTVRAEEANANPFLTALLQHLRRERQISEIELTRLNVQETAALANQIVAASLDQERTDELYRETEGNPLFVVETMRSIESWRKQDGEAALDVRSPISALPSLPPKVQAVIEARLDQLSPPARALADLAAVVGREFTFDVLARAGDGDEDALVQGLDELWQRRIIRERSADAYDFSHDKIREVTYTQISQTRRRLLHHRVAGALEHLYDADPSIGQGLDDVSGQVAAHYERAGLTERAIAYYRQAAAAAQRIYANQESLDFLNRALALLETLPDSAQRAEEELSLLTALGVSQIVLEGYGAPNVRATYHRVRALCQRLNRPLSPPLLRIMAIIALVWPELPQAYKLAEQLLHHAQEERDLVSHVEAHYLLGVVSFWQGQLIPAREHLEEAIDGYDPRRHLAHVSLYGQDPKAVCLSRLALVLWHLGYPDRAEQMCQRALSFAGQLSHPFSLAYVHAFAAWLNNDCRNLQATQEYAANTVSLSRAQGLEWWQAIGTILGGWILSERDEPMKGIVQIQQGIAEYRATKQDLYLPYSLALLAQAYAKVGKIEQGLKALAEALRFTKTNGMHFWEAEIYGLQGELLLAKGAPEDGVELCFHQALEVAQRQQAKILELRAAMRLSRLWQKQGKQAEAHRLLAGIYNWFSEGFDTPDLVEAKALLDSLPLSAP